MSGETLTAGEYQALLERLLILAIDDLGGEKFIEKEEIDLATEYDRRIMIEISTNGRIMVVSSAKDPVLLC